MRNALWVFVCLTMLAFSAHAQAIQVRNALSDDAPLAFDARAVIEGEGMLDDNVIAQGLDLPFELAGVTVTISGQPCQIASVTRRTIVFVTPSPFSAFRGGYLLTLKTPLLTISKFVRLQRIAPVLAIQNTRPKSKLVSGFWRGSTGLVAPILDTGIPTTNSGNVFVTLIGSGFCNSINRPQAVVFLKAPDGRQWELTASIATSKSSEVIYKGPFGTDLVEFVLPSEARKAGICEVWISVEGRSSQIAELKID